MNAEFKRIFMLIFVISMAFFCMAGCSDDDDDNLIEVCNYDNEEYQVRLYSDDDGMLVDEFELEEAYEYDPCDGFDNLDDGWYYITIHEDGSDSLSDVSDTFYVDSNAYIYFGIDSSGDLED